MTIDKMLEQFKSVEELQAYCNSQFKTIVELSRKLNDLHDENVHLKKLMDDAMPMVGDAAARKDLYLDVTDGEAICRMQLKLLRDVSLERELTLEEAKKTEIYSKVLDGPKKPSKNEAPPSRISDEDLLKALEKM